ncbi:MAG: hypothetical protein ACYC36_12640 [Bellilinea sp.]
MTTKDTSYPQGGFNLLAALGALHLHLVHCTCPTTARAVRPQVLADDFSPVQAE